VYIDPEPAAAQSFNSFVDCLFLAILDANLIRDSIAILPMNAIRQLGVGRRVSRKRTMTRKLCRVRFRQKTGLNKAGIDLAAVASSVRRNPFLQDLPPDFPLFREAASNSLFVSLVTQTNFKVHLRTS